MPPVFGACAADSVDDEMPVSKLPDSVTSATVTLSLDSTGADGELPPSSGDILRLDSVFRSRPPAQIECLMPMRVGQNVDCDST